MRDVPNIVRQRLKTAQPDSAHPDANVLTAFAEKSLPERERADVVTHLARCGSCRDVVALVLPESEAAEVVAIKPAPARYFTWPALRWGVVAAGVAIVASFAILRDQRSQNVAMLAKPAERSETIADSGRSSPELQPNAPTAADKQEPAETRKGPAPSSVRSKERWIGSQDRDLKPQSQPLTATAVVPRTLEGSGGGIGVGSIGGPVHSFAPRKFVERGYQARTLSRQALPAVNMPSADLAATRVAPKASTTVDVSAEAAPSPGIKTETSPAEQESANDVALTKAKPAVPPPAQPMNLAASAVPRWTINAAGGLQRSFDQGQTWQDVDVTSSTMPAASAEVSSANKAVSGAEFAKARPMVLKRQAVSPTFRAVTMNGSEVWAGGGAGALFHSVDAGTHWARVMPSSAGVVLTGDIVRIEFADVQHGTVATSTGEVWITTDDGQTWRKQ